MKQVGLNLIILDSFIEHIFS